MPGREAQVMPPRSRAAQRLTTRETGGEGGGVARGGDFEFEPKGATWVRQWVGNGGGGGGTPVGAAEDEFVIEPIAAGEAGRVGVVDPEPRLGGFADAVGVELEGGAAVAEAEAHGLTVYGEIVGGAHVAAVQTSFSAIAADRMRGGGQTEKCLGGRTTYADRGARQHGEARDGGARMVTDASVAGN